MKLVRGWSLLVLTSHQQHMGGWSMQGFWTKPHLRPEHVTNIFPVTMIAYVLWPWAICLDLSPLPFCRFHCTIFQHHPCISIAYSTSGWGCYTTYVPHKAKLINMSISPWLGERERLAPDIFLKIRRSGERIDCGMPTWRRLGKFY